MKKNYDHRTKKRTLCVKHQKYCKPDTGSWRLRENGWECSDTHVSYPEFIPMSLRNDRVTHANDQLQSTRNGEYSREFFEAHPQQTRKMLKGGAITKNDIKKSKYVWKGDVPGVTKKVDAEDLAK